MAALKAQFKTAEEVPQEYKGIYKQDGTNGWVLDVEGMEPAAKIEEYRRTNIDLQMERDDKLKPALKSYEDIGSVDDFKHLKAISDQLDEGKLIRSGKLEEAVEKRMQSATKDWEAKITKLTQEREALNGQLSQKLINEAVTSTFLDLGGKKTAIEDIVRRAREVMKVEDGKVVFYDKEGKRDYMRAGDDAVAGWIKELQAQPTAQHLFEENRGAGGGAGAGGAQHQQQSSGGAGGGGRYTGPNPWKKEEGKPGNLTLRMKLQKENPALAKRLRVEAGLKETL